VAALKDLARGSSEFAEARKPFSSKISCAQRRDKRDAIEAVAQEMDAEQGSTTPREYGRV
jgi:hypothetical protein